MMQQRVDQRPAFYAGANVDHHSGRFIDRDKILVFVNNLQRQRLRERLTTRMSDEALKRFGKAACYICAHRKPTAGSRRARRS